MNYVITDIHGCSKTFRTLLERSGLRQQDTLYLLGDYVDRGPDSCGVLTHVLELVEGGFDVRPIKGNHDALMMLAHQQPEHGMAQWWHDNWGEDVIKSFNVSCLNEIQENFWNFLRSLERVIETDDYIFVHGCLDPAKDDPVAETDPYTMLWGSTWHADGIKGKTVVSGHVVCPMDVIQRSLHTKHILLDNGCYHSNSGNTGNLVLLDLDSKEIITQPLLDYGSDWRA